MSNPSIKLIFFTQYYKIFDNQSLVVCNITSHKDKNFYIQLRFIQNSIKINLSFIKEKLEKHIDELKINNKLFFNDKNKINFLNELRNLDLDLNLTEIIHNKSQYKISNNVLVKEYNKNQVNLFCIDASPNCRFGYEIPESSANSYTLLCCAQIYNEKKLRKKIYFFPLNERSLNSSISLLKQNITYDQLNLGIPFVEYHPSISGLSVHYEKETQTRINLQTIISETLAHLEKQKYFRKNGSKKVELFNTFAKDIASGKSLNTISDQLNQHDIWVVLAQHRDPWSFFSFFKGKTHSVMAWEALKEEIAEFTKLSSPQALFHELSI